MNKADIMRQKTLADVLREMVLHEPGVTSKRLWDVAKEWDHRLIATEFDRELSVLRGSFYCTNQKWYPKGHQAKPKLRGPSKEDPRQTRMFG